MKTSPYLPARQPDTPLTADKYCSVEKQQTKVPTLVIIIGTTSAKKSPINNKELGKEKRASPGKLRSPETKMAMAPKKLAVSKSTKHTSVGEEAGGGVIPPKINV
jgi:hypothetical protein